MIENKANDSNTTTNNIATNNNNEDLHNFFISLPTQDEPNLMEDYRKKKTYEPPEDITPIIQQIEENRENFLNFDFNINDLKAYLFKHIIMRAERTLIKRALDERKQQMNMNTTPNTLNNNNNNVLKPGNFN